MNDVSEAASISVQGRRCPSTRCRVKLIDPPRCSTSDALNATLTHSLLAPSVSLLFHSISTIPRLSHPARLPYILSSDDEISRKTHRPIASDWSLSVIRRRLAPLIGSHNECDHYVVVRHAYRSVCRPASASSASIPDLRNTIDDMPTGDGGSKIYRLLCVYWNMSVNYTLYLCFSSKVAQCWIFSCKCLIFICCLSGLCEGYLWRLDNVIALVSISIGLG